MSNSKMVSLRPLSLFLLLASAVCLSFAVDIKIDDSKAIAEVSPMFASFTLDWWGNSYKGWNDSGLFNIQLNDRRLLYLVKQLAPAHLRLGGTLADTIVYEVDPPKPHATCTQDLNCLNTTRWSQIQEFVKETGFELAFGLNEKYPNAKPGEWDPSNSRDFINYSVSKKNKVWGWELGNELNMQGWNATQISKDFHTLKGIIDRSYPANDRPKLIGPDQVIGNEFLTEFLQSTAKIMDVVTYHLYIGAGGDPNLPELMMTPAWLDRTRQFAAPIAQIHQKYAHRAQLWVGEGAAAYNSGRESTTNTFRDGFWYIDNLGTLASLNHKVHCRQALVGGNYEVIAKEIYQPNPDYWTVLLWKRVMSTRVFQVQVSGDEMVRAYAHCSKKTGLTLAYLNLNNVPTPVSVSASLGHLGNVRVEYFLTSDALTSTSIQLNGVTLKLTGQGEIPSLTGKTVTGSAPLVLPAHSYGYIQFPEIPVVCH